MLLLNDDAPFSGDVIGWFSWLAALVGVGLILYAERHRLRRWVTKRKTVRRSPE